MVKLQNIKQGLGHYNSGLDFGTWTSACQMRYVGFLRNTFTAIFRLLMEYEEHLRNTLKKGMDAESYSLHTFEALLTQSMENLGENPIISVSLLLVSGVTCSFDNHFFSVKIFRIQQSSFEPSANRMRVRLGNFKLYFLNRIYTW